MREDIRPGSDIRKHWPHVNELKTEVRRVGPQVRSLESRVAALEVRERKRDRGGGSAARWS